MDRLVLLSGVQTGAASLTPPFWPDTERCLGVKAPLRKLEGSNVMLLSLRLQNPLDVEERRVGAVDVVLVVSSSRRM